MSHDGPPKPGSAGFTLVEVVIAIIVLTVGVLGMAGTTAYVVRQVALANVMTERSVALQTVVEQVQAAGFANVTDGSDSIGRYAMSWTTSLETPTSMLVNIVTTGPGLGTSAGALPFLTSNVSDTFQIRVIN